MTDRPPLHPWLWLTLALVALALILWANGPYPSGGYPDWSQPYAAAP